MSCRALLQPLLLATVFVGFARIGSSAGDRPHAVAVSRPVQRQVADTLAFTGRLEAAATVDLRARVTGYLEKVFYKAGTQVKKGQLLFEIDPRLARASLNKAEAEFALAKAVLTRCEAEMVRARKLKAAISREELDKSAAARAEAEAALKVAEAKVAMAKLDLSFTQLRAPIDGTIGRPILTPGNLVQADKTTLATIVSTDPVYVRFDVDERTLLRLRRLRGTDKIKPDALPLVMGLADEKGFPHKGIIDGFGLQVNPAKGTITVRGQFANANGLFVPGLSARVQMPLGISRKLLLVSEGALLKDRAGWYVLLVNDKNVVERRNVTLGERHGKLRAIQAGLKPEAGVVVPGRPFKEGNRSEASPKDLRAGAKATPRRIAMPGSEDN
jgi:RND family efflux transporter MFP subunit